MKKIILFLLLILPCSLFTVSAQTKKMDSLKVQLNKATQDTTRVRIYFALIEECETNENLKYAEPTIKLLDKLIAKAANEKEKKKRLDQKADAYGAIRTYYDDKKDTTKVIEVQQIRISIYQEAKDTEGVIGQIRGLSNYYMDIGNHPKGIEYCKKALSVAKEMKYQKGVAGCLRQVAQLYMGQGEYTQAMENYQQSVSIFEELKDTLSLASALMSEGSCYSKFHNVNKALECYNKAILLFGSKKDKDRVRWGYNCIGLMYEQNNKLPEALVNLQKSMTMSEEMKDNYWIGVLLNNIGRIYEEQGNIDKALEYNLKALKVNEELKIDDRVWHSCHYLAVTYMKLKNFNKAKEYMDRAFELEKHTLYRNNEFELLASQIDSARGDNKGAFEHYKQYIILTNKLKSEEVHKLAQNEKYQKEFDKQKAADKAEQDKKDEAAKAESKKQKLIILFVALGLLLVLVFAGFVFRSLRIRNKQNKIIVEQKEKIALLNTISNEINSSLNLERVMSSVYKNLSSLMDISFFLISTYNETDESVEVKYCVKHGQVVKEDFKTSVLNPNSYTAWTIKNKREVIIMDEETERANYLNGGRTLHGKEDTLTNTVIFIPLLIKEKVIGLYSVQSVKKNAYSTSDIETLRSLSSVIAVALNNADSYNKLDTANVEISKQKEVVEEKQREILDSIEYALRIQTAILPPQKIIKQYLENSFILYKPKDIVAGDFYWMETKECTDLPMKEFTDETNPHIGTSANQNIILFAACDCTGHGVPGAMVSVVCHNALNRAVREFGLTKPSDILDKTAEIVIENFATSEEDIKDGMDISLVSLEFGERRTEISSENGERRTEKRDGQQTTSCILNYAGANNPLWIVKSSENGERSAENSQLLTPNSVLTSPDSILIETKADKQPIGMNEDNHPFTNHEFTLNSGDTIYLFTDGFADQFGGETGDKKLTRKHFKELILSIQHLSMAEQGIELDKFILEYRKTVEQIDDILVMGVRV